MACLYLFPEFPQHFFHIDILADATVYSSPSCVPHQMQALYLFHFLSSSHYWELFARRAVSFFSSAQTDNQKSVWDETTDGLRYLSELCSFFPTNCYFLHERKQTVGSPDTGVCLLKSGGCRQSLRKDFRRFVFMSYSSLSSLFGFRGSSMLHFVIFSSVYSLHMGTGL